MTAALSNVQLATVLLAIGESQETALMSFTEDGSCVEYLREAATRIERIADLEKTLQVYGRHRANCMIHFRDKCSCGWDEAGKIIGINPDKPGDNR